MEEYRIRVENYKFISNEEFKFTNTMRRTKLYVISNNHRIEDPYKYIFDLIKKGIENDADEVYIRIHKKSDEDLQ